jgi:hypothetical protein
MRRQTLEEELQCLAPPADPDLDRAQELLDDFARFWHTEPNPAECRKFLAILFDHVWQDNDTIVAVKPRPAFAGYFKAIDQPDRNPRKPTGDAGDKSGEAGTTCEPGSQPGQGTLASHGAGRSASAAEGSRGDPSEGLSPDGCERRDANETRTPTWSSWLRRCSSQCRGEHGSKPLEPAKTRSPLPSLPVLRSAPSRCRPSPSVRPSRRCLGDPWSEPVVWSTVNNALASM